MAAALGTPTLRLSRDCKPIISKVFGYGQKPGVQHLTFQKLKSDISSQFFSAFPLCTTEKSRVKFLKKKMRVFCSGSPEGQALSTTMQSDVQLQDYFDDTIQESISSVESDSLPHVQTANGKSGFASFYGGTHENPLGAMNNAVANERKLPLVWHLGPAVLVTSVVLPPFCSRWFFESVLADSLLTDFLILFFTEALFYSGVAVFIQLMHYVQKPFLKFTSKEWNLINRLFRYRAPSVGNLLLNVATPLVCMALVWQWTGLATCAVLTPYLVGIIMQFAFEQFVAHKRTSAWPVVPIIFEIYRLHQLNRATRLVAYLIHAIKGAEATAQTLAINRSLQTLLDVIQVLGVFCLWSLASFLMRLFPSHPEPLST